MVQKDVRASVGVNGTGTTSLPRLHVRSLDTPDNSADLSLLRGYFSESDLVWRPSRYSADRNRAMVVAHVRDRAIMDRLDSVCGPENWHNRFGKGPNGGALCGLSIRVRGEWVTKWDSAEILPYLLKTTVTPSNPLSKDPRKTSLRLMGGGLRRAALLWGIGRYLQRMPSQWIPVDDTGRLTCRPNIPPGYRSETRHDPLDSTLLDAGYLFSKAG